MPTTTEPFGPPAREFQELWFALARKDWQSAVIVPADASVAAGGIACSLADVGRRLGFTAVNALVAESLDFASVGPLASRVAAPRLRAQSPEEALTGQLVVALPPVVVQPLGVVVARAADVVVLCIAMGRTRLSDAQKTIDLVGRERLAGTFLVT